MRYTVWTHNYSAYANGCRCDVCRAAKADYMAARRAAAFLKTSQPAGDITHGRAGYEEQGCRCEICVEARRAMWRQGDQQRAARAGAA